MMKRLFLGLLCCALGAASLPALPTAVRFSLVPFTFGVKAYPGERFTVTEARILGDFNGWGQGGFDFPKVWDGSLPLVKSDDTGLLEAVSTFESGTTILFTYVLKAEGDQGHSWSGWYDPFAMRALNGACLFSPMGTFVDNGVGNGGHNAKFVVP